MTATAPQHVVIGTAGHIDHGKTRLVGRLSNIDTDRLPEEKSRGISIDLGFAHWETDGFQFGIIDVPGHERFVKNMVAGATGMNLAMLVVAADDGVMPQTREHLEIMQLLGVQTGVVAITKTDLVDADFVELVMAELEELTTGTFLADCPIIPVSSETGEGIDRLRETLAEVAAKYRWPAPREHFRMPIDRIFSLPGHGTVVTGTVLSGDVQPGASLELLPQQTAVRVRSVQNHHESTEASGARQRTAINLAGVKADEVVRGNELAATGYLQPTQRLLVELQSLSGPGVTIKHRRQFTLHLATSETPARVILKEGSLTPGESCFAELRLDHPVVAEFGQRFILRRLSPAITVAGGRILDPHIEPRRRIKDPAAICERLAADDEIERLSCVYSLQDRIDPAPALAAWRAGITPETFEVALATLKKRGETVSMGRRDRKLVVHRERVARLAESVLKKIRSELARHQPRRALPKTTLATACRNLTTPELLDAIFELLHKDGRLVRMGENLGPSDAQVQLTKRQRAMREEILSTIDAGGLAPPTLKELATSLKQDADQVRTLLDLCAEDGLLVKIAEGIFFTTEHLMRAGEICRDYLIASGPSTMSQLREAWGNSRKYAVPLCEYFDEQQLTIRDGDLRLAGPRIDGD